MLHSLLTAMAVFAAVGAALLVVISLRALRRLRVVRRGAWVVVEIAGAVAEVPAYVPRWRRLLGRGAPQPPSVMALRRLVARVSADARVTGVVIRLGELSCGWATATSLRDLILSLRASGKRVIAYLPHGGMTREVFIAVAADKVYAAPQASVSPIGVASGTTFFKVLLARGGIEADVLARREFKSATEPFTSEGFSEPSRLQTNALLDATMGEVVAAISKGREITEAAARVLIDQGPYRARDALAAGLIDGVAYDDELMPLLGEGATTVKAPEYLGFTRGSRLTRVLRRGRGKRVGLVEVRGPIVSEARMAFGRVADADRVVAALRAARADDSLGAVVLYVDSPGGSALASDLIAREVERLREKKPVVAYFSDVSASGGYYVSAMANEIVAQPLTVTGSIGVFALRFVVQRAIEKLGITHEVIRRGARADIMSPYRHWTDDERGALDREIDGFYNDFVGIVARGRGKTPEQIEPLARGRVYAGKDAHACGLVDVLGGLDTAVARAAALAKLDGLQVPTIVRPPRRAPDPPEPPAPLQPIVARLGSGLDAVNLALNAGSELLFAFEDDLRG